MKRVCIFIIALLVLITISGCKADYEQGYSDGEKTLNAYQDGYDEGYTKGYRDGVSDNVDFDSDAAYEYVIDHRLDDLYDLFMEKKHDTLWQHFYDEFVEDGFIDPEE